MKRMATGLADGSSKGSSECPTRPELVGLLQPGSCSMGSSALPGIALERFAERSKKSSDWPVRPVPVWRPLLPWATLGDDAGLPKSCWPA